MEDSEMFGDIGHVVDVLNLEDVLLIPSSGSMELLRGVEKPTGCII